MISLTTVAIVIFAFILWNYFKKQNGRVPPGPIGLPFIGSLLSVTQGPHLAFDKWRKVYGPIFSVKLGRQNCLVLNDVKLIKEAFNEPAFSGRPNNKSFQLLSEGKFGVIASDGEDWEQQRRFTLRNLRDFGFGKSSMETLVMEEVKDVINWMKKNEGNPVSIQRKFALSVLNALWTILSGERYDPDDAKLSEIMEIANKSFNDLAEGGIGLFFPELAEMFPGVTGWNKVLKAIVPFKAIFEDVVVEHEKNPADEQSPRDFIDVYMNEIKKTTDPNSSFYKELGRKSLVATIGDLHGAGSETTSETLTWTILYLIRHPEVQRKFHEEIDQVVGNSRLPSLADKPKMSYTEALVSEVLRCSSLVPVGVFHSALREVEFHGYVIPKDTMIIANQYSVLNDKTIWGDPQNFRPERFLSADGKTFIKNDALIPFSTGKRVCLGESLARDELFLFLTSIFQRFTISPDPENLKPTLEPKCGFLQVAKPYKIVIKDRQP